MNKSLPTHVLVTAAIRNAESQGVYIAIAHKGDADRGTLYVIVDDLSGQRQLYQQVYDGEKSVMQLHTKGADVEHAARRIVDFDPDAWVIEVTDRQGRIWFDAVL